MKTAVVTGATGFLGKRLVRALQERGVSVTAIARDPARASATLGADIPCLEWDHPNTWRPRVRDADAVFHLAGESVAARRWTPEQKQVILHSRTDTTRALVDAGPRGVFVCASAVGYYGDRGARTVTEDAWPGSDFLAQVCVAWEEEAIRAESTAARVARMRIGFALGADGGPLAALLPFFRRGLGGPMGNGSQWLPWVHADDVTGLLLFAAETEAVSGPINVVSPDPVTNAQFAAALSHTLRRPALFPIPGLALRVGLGEMGDALLASQRVLPARAQELGYTFRFPDLNTALQDLLQ